MPLNDRQCRFVAEYLVDLNATQAAVRAGYSARTARTQAADLLTNPNIAAAIAEAQAARGRRTEVTADRVVLELARVAFGDPRRVMSWGPGGVRLRPSAELADEEAAIVAEVGETTTKEGGSLRLKTVDKLGALRLLGQHLGLFLERRQVEATTLVVTPLDFSAADEKEGMVERLPGYGSAASAYLPPLSSTWPVTASRISACTTSCLSCRPASASTIAGLVRGTPSASSSRMAGATRRRSSRSSRPCRSWRAC